MITRETKLEDSQLTGDGVEALKALKPRVDFDDVILAKGIMHDLEVSHQLALPMTLLRQRGTDALWVHGNQRGSFGEMEYLQAVFKIAGLEDEGRFIEQMSCHELGIGVQLAELLGGVDIELDELDSRIITVAAALREGFAGGQKLRKSDLHIITGCYHWADYKDPVIHFRIQALIERGVLRKNRSSVQLTPGVVKSLQRMNSLTEA